MKTWTALILIAIAAGPSVAAPLWEAPEPDATLTTAVVRRNIFLADRAALEAAARQTEAPPVVVEARPAAPPPPPPDPDASRVLVGVVVVDGQPTAFVEDRAAGRIDRVTGPGDFGAGRITEITLTGVTYAAGDDEPRTIGLRQTFAGERADPAPASTPAASGGAAASNLSPASGDGLSLIERMRRRRAQESAPPPPATTPGKPPVPSEEPTP